MVDIDKKLIDIYLQMTENLGNNSKLELISRLIDSMKDIEDKSDNSLLSLFGALKTNETAEELIEKIRASRNFTRKIEGFE